MLEFSIEQLMLKILIKLKGANIMKDLNTNNFELKQKVLDELKKGTKVRIIDFTGEFTALVKHVGGKTIPIDEIGSIPNVLNDEMLVSFTQGDLQIMNSNSCAPQILLSPKE